MDFSIVVPAYNEEKTIKKCLNALFKLKYPKNKYEVIVVNNNSTDQTKNIVKSYKNVTFLNEYKQGISFARQKGLNFAKGKYYISIDADTVLPINYLQKATSIINKHPNAACIFGPVMAQNYYKIVCNIIYFSTIAVGFITKHIYNCNAIYNTKILKKYGGFSTKYKYFEDGIITAKFKKTKQKIIFSKNLKAFISIRRYKGLKALSIFKNLFNYYYYYYFNKIPFKKMDPLR